MTSTLQDIANVLPRAALVRGGSEVSACCPAHDDSNPSLSVTEKDGKILVYCHAGCEQERVLEALKGLGITLSDEQPSVADLKYAPVELGTPPPDFRHLLRVQPANVWTYLDLTGKRTLGYICRWDTNSGKEIRPVTPWRDNGGSLVWRVQAMPAPRPLYGLEFLLTNPSKPVLIVEGEKAADAARLLPNLKGYIVMTWPGGAKAVDKVDWLPLKGRTVKVWPDNDGPGRSAAERIKIKLEEINKC